MSANKGQQPPQGVPPQPYEGGDPNGGVIPPSSEYDERGVMRTPPEYGTTPQPPPPQQPVPMAGVGRGLAQMPLPAPPPPQMRPETTGTQYAGGSQSFHESAPTTEWSQQKMQPQQTQVMPPEQGQKTTGPVDKVGKAREYQQQQQAPPPPEQGQKTTGPPQQQQAPPAPQEQQPQGPDRDFARRKLRRGIYG